MFSLLGQKEIFRRAIRLVWANIKFPKFFSAFVRFSFCSTLNLMNYENLYRQWSWSDDRGKRSPDGQFREAFYNREIAKRVVADLIDRGYDAELLVPEDDDVSIAERVRRVNTVCFLLGKQNVILVSIHVNAAGNGSKWLNATGWSVYTCKGQTESDKLAECLC